MKSDLQLFISTLSWYTYIFENISKKSLWITHVTEYIMGYPYIMYYRIDMRLFKELDSIVG